MVVKGEIQSVDYTGNTCIVRMPIFESAGGGEKATAPAVINNAAAIANYYMPGDIVYVAFENDELSMPVIIGKLFISTEHVEQQANNAAIHIGKLVVGEDCTIPLNTKLVLSSPAEITVDNASTVQYDSLKKIVDKLIELDIKSSNEAIQNVQYLGPVINNVAKDSKQAIVKNTGYWVDNKQLWQAATSIKCTYTDFDPTTHTLTILDSIPGEIDNIVTLNYVINCKYSSTDKDSEQIKETSCFTTGMSVLATTNATSGKNATSILKAKLQDNMQTVLETADITINFLVEYTIK